MSIEDIPQIELTIVFFDVFFVIISTIISIKMIFKYFELRKKVFLTAGLTWISLSTSYWSSPIACIYYLLFNKPINSYLYISLNNVQTGLILMFWMYTFCHLLYPERKKVILTLFFSITIILETIMVVLIIIAPYYIATITGYCTIKPELYSIIFKFFVLIIIFISLVIFYRKSMKYGDTEIQWKSRFLILAMISFGIGLLEIIYVGLFVQSITVITFLMIFIFRIFLISSAIEFYLGFFLPKKVAHWIIKNDQ
ncbi:MAG: hypothetical protein ACFFAO_02580 [Candidatus Hermodarchaeota archaeon]